MKRRGFLKSLAGMLAVPLVAPLAAMCNPTSRPTVYRVPWRSGLSHEVQDALAQNIRAIDANNAIPCPWQTEETTLCMSTPCAECGRAYGLHFAKFPLLTSGEKRWCEFSMPKEKQV